ncbi:RES domain-containing protein [Hydrogenispora ethanolica]|uniref:RES domain-containing protein n=1 Tax=Hydrogenispora ethanolica TaxID=1082276 RepID=A0A4R1R338_HYDET|nr:RES family NAD+ phosphorylase [Hydrogenispora ethanolica]TCL59712.1 RES domain-containing protein [Hydrogenispora ethanolica]
MICCKECFKDTIIRATIEKLNQIGACELCGKENVFIYNTDTNNQLEGMFDDLLDIYTINDDLPNNYPSEDRNLLKDELCIRWNIFNLDSDLADKAIVGICHKRYEEHPELFNAPIGILELNQEEYLQENSIMKTCEWEDFVEGLKTINRFHTDCINKEKFFSLCNLIKKSYKTRKVFYRARICTDKTGFNTDEMGAPPSDKATAGRANSAGISCLYLADTAVTAINEIRAGIYDYVAVGKFILKQDIEVIDLTHVDQISPFWGSDKKFHAVNKKHLQKISHDIAKPMRRHDSLLDYLPTQYISDFIKSCGFAGIEYQSTMNKDGYNLAIFDETLYRCSTVNVYDIRRIKYKYDKLSD